MAQTPTDPTKAQVWITKGIDDLDFEFYIPSGPKGDPGGITLGTILNSTSNLNDFKTSGIYRLGTTYSGLSLLNYPRDTDSGILVVYERVVGQTLVQEWHSMQVQGRGYYLRHMTNTDVWSTWRFITSSRVDQTAGRAIYQWDDINNRDQLIYGDTGQRNILLDQPWIDALFPANVVANAGGIVRVRRVGYEVELLVALDKNASGSISSANAFPLGFRPAQPVQALGSNSGLVIVRAYHGGGATGINWNSSAVATAASITMKYTTADPWPTTLPGTAIGGVPNT